MQRTKERSQVSNPANGLSARCAGRTSRKKAHFVQFESIVTTLFLCLQQKNHQNCLSFLGPGQLQRLCLSACLIMEDNRPINGIENCVAMAMPALNPKTGPPEDVGWAVRAETTPTFFLLKQHCCLLLALMYLGHCQHVKEWDFY